MSEFVAMLVPALGRALLHFLWQGAAVGLLAAMLLQWQRDARARYVIACMALAACLLVPTTSLLLELATPAVATSGTAPWDALPRLAAVVGDSAGPAPWWSRIDASLPMVVALWAAGASILCLRTCIGLLWLRRLRATPQHTALPRWQARLDVLAGRFGLRGVALRIVPGLASPVATGWLRPVVLLPAAVVARMPVEFVEALLAHELAHVRRHDYLVNLLQTLVEALLFYHPVVWWLLRRIRSEREVIADAMAADAIGDPRRLARALAALAEPTAPGPALPHLAPAAHGGSLMPRIQLLVRPAQKIPRAGRIALPTLGIAAACIAFYAQAQIGTPAPAAPTTTAAATTARTPQATAERSAQGVAAAHAQAERAASQARGAARAAARSAAQVTRIANQEGHDAFALVRKGEAGVTLSGSTDDARAIETLRRGVDGDFLWFRRGDKAYVVVDPALVARADAAWRDSNALGEQMHALGREMDVHGKKMAGYGAQMEKLAGTRAPTPALRQAHARMQALAEEQQLIAGQQMKLARDMRRADDAERLALEARSGELSEQMEGLSAQMERQGKVIEAETAQLERNREPMEALGRQMEEAGKPMEALGARMEALGKQQEALVREAERRTQALISEALQKEGLAKPVPAGARAQ